ncbi:thiamine transport system ATP-binding protein [Pararhizobium capsulatum DSM 1112]|uniref:Thiamine transport system ATP-binding protein n=1 Tax=Pararhizobium capsulatum DSM 1112 TaxID=1121113 RepID=A0ABU0BI79_9HYPH|nr:thiamine ABC transporter ATP-binding protein [Pararhizobium capsulatum]MDQ0317954.1 thiamine transport system ATP-binding protein [Pararhizobium capsulatum DSM 1112]
MTVENDNPAIFLDSVRVDFGKTRLSFTCAFQRGEIVAVTGASGSGKSTLLNIVAGFERPDRGRVVILGRDMTDTAPGERPVSVIFQDHNLFTHLDVGTNVGLGIDPGLKLDVADKARIAAALLRVGLDGFAKRMPATLSGGERQRIALARALVRRRPILLLDEPFAALDPALRTGMGALILDLRRNEEVTILLVTHHPEDVRRLADSVVFLEQGAIIVQEPKVAFLERAAPAEIARFLEK